MCTVTVVCINVGDKYAPEYVEKLRNGVARHLSVPYQFVCVTDRPEVYDGVCETRQVLEGFPGWWSKVTLFADEPYGLHGDLLFLDLDVVILDSIDELAIWPGEFAIIRDWNRRTSLNSSVFKLQTGTRPEVFERWTPALIQKYHGDQDWITVQTRSCHEAWPEAWCLSYKMHCRVVPRGKIVVFHGKPDPHECGGWVAQEWV